MARDCARLGELSLGNGLDWVIPAGAIFSLPPIKVFLLNLEPFQRNTTKQRGIGESHRNVAEVRR